MERSMLKVSSKYRYKSFVARGFARLLTFLRSELSQFMFRNCIFHAPALREWFVWKAVA